MFVEKGDAADLKANATRVRLETVLFEMSPGVTQLTDAYQCTILHLVSFALAPEALVAKLLIGPVPWAVDSGLNAADMPRVEGGCGGSQVVGDVAAKASIGIRACEAAGRLQQSESFVRELLT